MKKWVFIAAIAVIALGGIGAFTMSDASQQQTQLGCDPGIPGC